MPLAGCTITGISNAYDRRGVDVMETACDRCFVCLLGHASVTVAILAQGTSWADAATQAF